MLLLEIFEITDPWQRFKNLADRFNEAGLTAGLITPPPKKWFVLFKHYLTFNYFAALANLRN